VPQSLPQLRWKLTFLLRAGEDGARGRTGQDVLVKICGVTRPEDALAAVQSGANLIGTIFCRSKRQVNMAQVGPAV
jgi:hypothetical protein